MINNIKLVSNFASRDKSHVFSNVLVKDGFMTAQNDMAGISVAVDSDIDFCCNAEKLNQVLNNCKKGKLKTSIKNERIYISSDRFKSNIGLIDENMYPSIIHDGENIDVQSDIITQLNSITQFTDPNDIRMPLRGVALTDGYIKATNGHIAIKKSIDHIDGIDEIIIPTKAIQLISKANTIINSLSIKENMIIFNFDDGFVFTRMIDQKMPDIDRVLSEIEKPTSLIDISEAVKSIAPMCGDSKTMLLGKTIQNQKGDALIDGFDLDDVAFNSDYLLKIIDVASVIDFSKYPGACPFLGEEITGAVIGIKI